MKKVNLKINPFTQFFAFFMLSAILSAHYFERLIGISKNMANESWMKKQPHGKKTEKIIKIIKINPIFINIKMFCVCVTFCNGYVAVDSWNKLSRENCVFTEKKMNKSFLSCTCLQ